MKKQLTCIECPMGCQIEVEMGNGNPVSISGNSCPRGKIYAQSEVVCPRRIITSTVKTDNGDMVCVKTDKPVKKSRMFEVMNKINEVCLSHSVNIGDVIVENIEEDANLVATSCYKY